MNPNSLKAVLLQAVSQPTWQAAYAKHKAEGGRLTELEFVGKLTELRKMSVPFKIRDPKDVAILEELAKNR